MTAQVYTWRYNSVVWVLSLNLVLRKQQRQCILGVVLFSLVFGFSFSVHTAYGGPVGGIESQVILVDDMYLKVVLEADPSILEGGEDHITLDIKIVNDDTHTPVTGVEYRLDIADLDGTNLLTLDVYSPDDTSYIQIIPSGDIAPQNTLQTRNTDDDTAWLASVTSPLVVSAPVFLDGGLVDIGVTILSIDSQPMLSDDQRLSIIFAMGKLMSFSVDVDDKPVDMKFSSYLNVIERFEYDDTEKKVSGYMPFTWSPEFIESIRIVHAEYFVPGDAPLFEDHEIVLSVNGVPYVGGIDRSHGNEIEIDYTLAESKLLEVYEQLSPNVPDMFIFEMSIGEKRPDDAGHGDSGGGGHEHGDDDDNAKDTAPKDDHHTPSTPKDDHHTPSTPKDDHHTPSTPKDDHHTPSTPKEPTPDYHIQISLGASLADECAQNNSCFEPSPIEIEPGQIIQWVNHDDSDHLLVSGLPSDGEPSGVFSSPLMSTDQTFMHKFSEEGQFEYYSVLHPHVTGVITVAIPPQPDVPVWVKSNALWWAEGQIDDNMFVMALEFLIKEGIIKISDDTQGSVDDTTEDTPNGVSIPDWIKNTALWWAEDLIDDAAFLQSITWMIDNGILHI